MYSQYLPDLIQSNLSFLEKNIEMAQNAHKKSTRYIIIMIFPPCKKNSIRHVPVTFKKCVWEIILKGGKTIICEN